jgi:hypothetical protein
MTVCYNASLFISSCYSIKMQMRKTVKREREREDKVLSYSRSCGSNLQILLRNLSQRKYNSFFLPLENTEAKKSLNNLQICSEIKAEHKCSYTQWSHGLLLKSSIWKNRNMNLFFYLLTFGK